MVKLGLPRQTGVGSGRGWYCLHLKKKEGRSSKLVFQGRSSGSSLEVETLIKKLCDRV